MAANYEPPTLRVSGSLEHRKGCRASRPKHTFFCLFLAQFDTNNNGAAALRVRALRRGGNVSRLSIPIGRPFCLKGLCCAAGGPRVCSARDVKTAVGSDARFQPRGPVGLGGMVL